MQRPAIQADFSARSRLLRRHVDLTGDVLTARLVVSAKQGHSLALRIGVNAAIAGNHQSLGREHTNERSAGLAEVDEAGWKDYAFVVPGKARDYSEDWQDKLRKAREGHKRGEKPRVVFEWPNK